MSGFTMFDKVYELAQQGTRNLKGNLQRAGGYGLGVAVGTYGLLSSMMTQVQADTHVRCECDTVLDYADPELTSYRTFYINEIFGPVRDQLINGACNVTASLVNPINWARAFELYKHDNLRAKGGDNPEITNECYAKADKECFGLVNYHDVQQTVDSATQACVKGLFEVVLGDWQEKQKENSTSSVAWVLLGIGLFGVSAYGVYRAAHYGDKGKNVSDRSAYNSI